MYWEYDGDATVKKYDFGVSRKWSYCYGAKKILKLEK